MNSQKKLNQLTERLEQVSGKKVKLSEITGPAVPTSFPKIPFATVQKMVMDELAEGEFDDGVEGVREATNIVELLNALDATGFSNPEETFINMVVEKQ